MASGRPEATQVEDLYLPELTASPQVLERVRRQLAEWAARAGLATGRVHDLVPAVYEAMANVAVHAYAGAPSILHLSARRDDARVTVIVTDRGRVTMTTWKSVGPPSSCHNALSSSDKDGMSNRRWALLATCVVVAGMGAVFAVVQWDVANRVATMASALGAVAAVGIAVWAALPSKRSASNASTVVRAERTGDAVSGGSGIATSGIRVRGQADGSLAARRTGAADATRGGDATSGVVRD
ncbi:ATP-binding protein [Amycolatopsis nalaikhensis]|uniref:ATP-binding protein n=1 Tax=Amycolatopsis nalaikhensis TaxID=715472 RepID=A0ABY8XU56_9PSEU|nr:ATP-binding protein [Amycolatopsis sp. 2-2]WIV59159.1 ATP-binding protein [Amycolatopsis sp. 2-2]